MSKEEEYAILLNNVFETLKKFKPEHTCINIGNVTASSSDVEVEIINEDPNYNGNEEDLVVIETFGFDADVSVIDGGIGAYEFWGAKGVDSHMQNEIQSLKMTDPWPEELKWLKEIIEEKVCEAIAEADVDDSCDDPEPPDVDECFFDR